MKSKEIVLKGHIIDSYVLPQFFNTVMDLGGEFKVKEFSIGTEEDEPSLARIVVKGKSQKHLEKILNELHELGISRTAPHQVNLKSAPKKGVAPEGFYISTHHPTLIFNKGRWHRVKDIEMDCCISVGTRTVCKPIGDLRKGEKVVVDTQGVRVLHPERPRGNLGVFAFMDSDVSSEKSTATLVKGIADELKQIKKNKGKIVIVAGPALLHSGAGPALAEMIKLGYVQGFLSGNAVAVHDLESQLLGTSLGIDMKTGKVTRHGHINHLVAINRIRGLGGIKRAITKKVIRAGVMYEIFAHNIPYVLAGSIRDDGPLYEVTTDSQEAQQKMRRIVKDADIVLMFASTLHSIATGNMLKSSVKTVCVDINHAVITKLTDRGSSQAAGVVTDIGSFLPELVAELKK